MELNYLWKYNDMQNIPAKSRTRFMQDQGTLLNGVPNDDKFYMKL